MMLGAGIIRLRSFRRRQLEGRPLTPPAPLHHQTHAPRHRGRSEEILAHWRETTGRWNALPYADGHVLGYVALAAGAMRTPGALQLAPALRAAIDEVDGRSAVI
jgi:hypothetical protein